MFKVKIVILLFATFSIPLFSQIQFSQATKVKKIYPMGEKIYLKKCSKIDVEEYSSMREMRDSIKSKKFCKPLNSKYFEALTLYLWEVKRTPQKERYLEEIKVEKDEKCPICGMFVYKYPRWATQIFYKDRRYSFDGMKDLMKYYFKRKEGVEKILVRDYYSQKTINAREAFYVIGSDVYGPMGHELVAFGTREEAKTFYMDHRAKKVVAFEEITQEEVYKLDE